MTRAARLLAPLALAACLPAAPTDEAPASGEALLPREEQLRINLPVEDTTRRRSGAWAEYYAVTREVTEHVNGLTAWVLGTVGYVTTLEPTWSDSDARTAVWGPYSDSGLDPVETGLWVREEDDGSHTWALFQVPRGGTIEDDAVAVVAGVVDAGSTRDDATGIFVADFDLAAALDPAVDLRGAFSVEYAYDASGVAAVAAFEDYGHESGELHDAVYAYDEDYAGAGWMDLALLQDVNASGTDELITLRSRWQADGQGRGDAQVMGGDLGGSVVSASECWDTRFETVYWTDSAGYREAEGDAGACAFAEAEYAQESDFAIAE